MIVRFALAALAFAATAAPAAAQECQRSRAPDIDFAEATSGRPSLPCVSMTGIVVGRLFVEDERARYRQEQRENDPSSSGAVLGFYASETFDRPTRVRVIGRLSDCAALRNEAEAAAREGSGQDAIVMMTGFCHYFSGRVMRAVHVDVLGEAVPVRLTRAEAGPDLGNLAPLAAGDTRTRMLAAAARFADAVRAGDRTVLAAMHGGGPGARRSPREIDEVLALLTGDAATTPFARLRSGAPVSIEIFGWKPPLWADEAWQRNARASGAEEAIACFAGEGDAAGQLWPIDSKDADNLAQRPYACTRIRLTGQGVDAPAQFDTMQARTGVAEPAR